MTLAELLAELEARDIKTEVIGGRLRMEAPPGAMPAWLQAAMLEHRAKLLALLAPETGAARTAPPAPPASAAVDVPTAQGEQLPVSTSPPLPVSSPLPVPVSPSLPISTSPPLPIGPEGALRIPLDDLVYGDFLARHNLRVVGGAAYPDGRHYRPTIYLADDAD